MISEINTNTCITFTQPNSTDAMYIKRYIHSLCVFINGEIFPRPSAWNRTFVCDKRDSTLSMCFSNTMTSDAGVFILIVGSVQRNTTTLEVEYPPYVRLSGTQKTVEGRNLNVTCSYISGKPPATMFYWTKTDSDFRFNGQFLWIPSIGRMTLGHTHVLQRIPTAAGIKGKQTPPS